MQRDRALGQASDIGHAVQAGGAGRRPIFTAAARGHCRGGTARIAGQRREASGIGASEPGPLALVTPTPREIRLHRWNAMRFGKRHDVPI
ncbi:MAG: hypothetical protein F4103_02865 [Boseongicola sp. SB0673_bin_14]|nr:hypothetical protein [Boseongicola sp. SB0667_bin_21]MYI67727.1 hypothetical protein [Boseongicola sp. SB0673_bin_14]